MKRTWMGMVVGCCLIALAASAHGQRKAGLWEVTSQMSMSGMPNMPSMGGQTREVCVSQAMVDKYGGPYSNPQNSECQVTNLSLTTSGMTANLTCTGRANGTGTVSAMFVDANTTKTTVQMNMTTGNGQQMNMTMQSTASFKGSDCGSVQPLALPPDK